MVFVFECCDPLSRTEKFQHPHHLCISDFFFAVSRHFRLFGDEGSRKRFYRETFIHPKLQVHTSHMNSVGLPCWGVTI